MPTEPLNSKYYLILITSLWHSTTIAQLFLFSQTNTELRLGVFSNLARVDLLWSLPADIWSRISVPQPEIEVRPQQWEHWSCPVASEKVLTSQRCRNKIWQNRWKILKQAKGLLEGRRVHLDTHTRWLRERELHPLRLNPLHEVCLPGSLWPVTLLCWVLSLCWVDLMVLPGVHTHLIAKTVLPNRTMSRLTSPTMGWCLLLFTSKQPFSGCVFRKVLTWRMRNTWSLYLGSAQLLLSSAIAFILEYLSTEDKLQLLNLGPIFLVPQNHRVNELVSEKSKLKTRHVWFLGPHTHRKFSSCSFQNSVVVLFFNF